MDDADAISSLLSKLAVVKLNGGLGANPAPCVCVCVVCVSDFQVHVEKMPRELICRHLDGVCGPQELHYCA